jgi:hypothetical protein
MTKSGGKNTRIVHADEAISVPMVKNAQKKHAFYLDILIAILKLRFKDAYYIWNLHKGE